jgi:hypothetical protein
MPTGLSISIRAPFDERLRTVQAVLPPLLNASVPCLNILRLGDVRRSFMAANPGK